MGATAALFWVLVSPGRPAPGATLGGRRGVEPRGGGGGLPALPLRPPPRLPRRLRRHAETARSPDLVVPAARHVLHARLRVPVRHLARRARLPLRAPPARAPGASRAATGRSWTSTASPMSAPRSASRSSRSDSRSAACGARSPGATGGAGTSRRLGAHLLAHDAPLLPRALRAGAPRHPRRAGDRRRWPRDLRHLPGGQLPSGGAEVDAPCISRRPGDESLRWWIAV
jgi:hypothetical protein